MLSYNLTLPMAIASSSSISRLRSLSSSNAFSRDSYASNKMCSPLALSLLHCSTDSKMGFICQWSRRKVSTFHIRASVTDVVRETSIEKAQLQKGDTWSVHKFGGTCVGSSQRIRNVAEIIINDDSERKLVVVSAMSKVTDMMYDLIYKAQSQDDSYITALDAVLEKHKLTALDLFEGDILASFLSRLHHDINNLKAMLRAIYIAGHATESFTDFVVGHGELWSAQMLASLVRKNGIDCNWMDTREVLIVNPTGSGQVDPVYLESEKRLEKWFSQNPSKTIIATGFIASTPQNIPTTLKRDGSDFSAAIMGALFRVRQVTIWTDVDGVYSADPRKVSDAVVLKTLSYQEAWEMSYFGANVLHPRTIIPVMQYDIPIVIRNVFNLSAAGTMICRDSVNEFEDGQRLESLVKGFATIDNLAIVNVEGTGMAGVPGTASVIFDAVKDVGANVIMISQASSEHSVCFAVPEKEVRVVAEALQSRFRDALDAGRISQVAVIPNCSILAAVGQKMASTPGVSATLFNALAKANINVRAIAQGCSEYNVTVVVKREDSVRALRAVHSRFYLSQTTMAVGIIGPGLIGGTLLDQFRDQAAVLKEKFNVDLRVMGITGSKRMLLNDMGIDLTTWRELEKEKGELADLEKFVQNVHGNHFIPNTVLVDCTADSSIPSHYYDWLRRGIHVITPNKRANSGPLDQYLRLRDLQRQSYTHYFYEATVGAGLPIISTLRGLLETGDKILRIEGIFSGTLSYIFNNFISTRAFSEVVAEAKEAGYTEPDPRDDLSGTDVARKVIILARESGLKLELSDIPIQSLVPEPLRGIASAEEFLQQLPQHDQDMAEKRQDAEDAKEDYLQRERERERDMSTTGMDSNSRRVSSSTSRRTSKRLLFDKRYGWVFDEWKDPSEEALAGGRGMFCLVPLARAFLDMASQSINFVGSSTVEVLKRPELLSPQALQSNLNAQRQKIISSIQKLEFNLFALKPSQPTSCPSHLDTESSESQTG